MNTERQLTQFRETFRSKNVHVNQDCLVYNTIDWDAEETAKEANRLIEKLNLNLVAIPSKTGRRNTFYVKSNLVEV